MIIKHLKEKNSFLSGHAEILTASGQAKSGYERGQAGARKGRDACLNGSLARNAAGSGVPRCCR